jgi:hypothetical protein
MFVKPNILSKIWTKFFEELASNTAKNLPTYANNAAAISGGLSEGSMYKTATGAVMVVYTP